MKPRGLVFALMVCALALGSAARAADAITTEEDFAEFTHRYYQHPRPELVESAMQYAVRKGLLNRVNAQAPLRATFTCLFARHPDHRPAWQKAIDALEASPRAFFREAFDTPPMQMMAEVEISPTRNDMNWGCFFVTGNERYVHDVIAMLGMLDERKSLVRFLAASSAQWSLASLAHDHTKVRAELQLAAAGSDARIAAGAREALRGPSEEIRSSTEKILREQHEAGVW